MPVPYWKTLSFRSQAAPFIVQLDIYLPRLVDGDLGFILWESSIFVGIVPWFVAVGVIPSDVGYLILRQRSSVIVFMRVV